MRLRDLRTDMYSEADRERLGHAVVAARDALGYRRKRAAFARLIGVSSRTLAYLEDGKRLGPDTIKAVVAHVSWWTEQTPIDILESEDGEPEIPNPVPTPAGWVPPDPFIKDLSHLTVEEQREAVGEFLDMLPVVERITIPEAAEWWKRQTIEFVLRYGGPEELARIGIDRADLADAATSTEDRQ